MSKSSRRLAVCLGLLLVVAATFFILNREQLLSYQEKRLYYRFSSEQWKETSRTDVRLHYYQARYLIDSSLLLGLSPEEIVARLGQPDANGAPNPTYIYYLGPERGKRSLRALNVTWMEITFAAGKVSAVHIK